MLEIITKSNDVAIFRALQLGDMMCAIPAIRSLKSKYPEKKITWIGLPGSEALARRYSMYIDSFIAFSGYPGLPEQTFDEDRYTAFLKEIRNNSYDLILQMQGNGTIVNDMIKQFGSTAIAGFSPTNSVVQNRFEHFISYPNFGPEINRHLLLMESLGIESTGTELEFPLHEQDYLDLEKVLPQIRFKKYICLHPGSRGSWRQWPPLYFAALGDYCIKMGYEVVITGTKEELPIVNHVAELMKGNCIIAAGKTSLGAVGALIKNAFALISNCTGVSHMAAALKTQSIVISMDGEPERWAPLNKQLHRTVDWTKTPDYNLVFKELASLFFRL
jgi:ADP-heptose:LPS heptosyltransferase